MCSHGAFAFHYKDLLKWNFLASAPIVLLARIPEFGVGAEQQEGARGGLYLDGFPQTTDLSWDGSLALCHRWMATFTRWPKHDAVFASRPAHPFGPLACRLTCSWVLVNIQRALTWKNRLGSGIKVPSSPKKLGAVIFQQKLTHLSPAM